MPFKKSLIKSEPKSSAGFGGIVPDAMTERFSYFVG